MGNVPVIMSPIIGLMTLIIGLMNDESALLPLS
jgi:hypothetical protein